MGHNLLKLLPPKDQTNQALIKIIFEAVTVTVPWVQREARQQRPFKAEDILMSPDSLDKARQRNQEHILTTIVQGYLARGLIQVTHKTHMGAENFPAGVINTVMVNAVFTDADSNYKDGKKTHKWRDLSKIDLILNAKPCNQFVHANKEALDFIRVYIPILKDIQDMSSVLLKARENGHDRFGKFDMLNAYAQIPLPKELQPYTMFRLGDTVYHFVTLPFGLSVSSHIFTIYFTIHLEAAKAKFLSQLVPQCVKVDSSFINTRNRTTGCRANFSGIHNDPLVRKLIKKEIVKCYKEPKDDLN
jgi:hypothetical protein